MVEKKTTKEYFRAIGRRKTAVAVVRLYKASKTSYTVNGKILQNISQHLN